MSHKCFGFMVAAMMSVSAPAMAQETTFKFAHFLPASHLMWEEGGRIFTDAVVEASGGTVKWNVYPAAQLGKDSLAVLSANLADVSLIAPSYAQEKFPLSAVVELPGGYSTSCEGTAKFWHLSQPGGFLAQEEFDALDIHPLFVLTLSPYKVMTSQRQVERLEDMAGLKLRVTGEAMDKTVRALGGVPVRIQSSEMYDSISRGTVDGALYPFGGVTPYKLEEVLHNAVGGPRLGSGIVIYAMSKKGWDRLPEDMKAIFTEAAAMAQEAACAAQDREDSQIRDQIVADAGFKAMDLPAEESARWDAALEPVVQDWAARMDAQGKKGSQALEAYRAASPEF
ncbi:MULTISPECIES: TRAP transporter substrate-binding protein DctP [Paracoccus]|uniref:TRAP-type C4-dicarboxylate transport system substrate-binding protein n=1 Tax=Paracoccus versutus TaxID=34007 RepID=A0A3D9XHY8_PARVE|nr:MULTISPECIES: TRAP transporter substrate-binding protein DctP [Paracoccus]REF68703.1 TRAP-type C4-dicarboxylate transport system substrate-binding protein [Paracoccus versutus]WGR56881.1 hypothetical protein E3U25_12565 [Paracoccus versutus]